MASEESKPVDSPPPIPVTLTVDQAKFLAECEEDYKDRYTETDADFTAVKENLSNTPPIIDPWYNKPRRNFDWADRRGRGGGGGGGGGYNQGGRNDRYQEGGYRQHRQNHGDNHRRDDRHGDHRQADRYQQRHRPY